MGVGPRFLLTLVIVLAALFGLALCGYNYWDDAPPKRDSLLNFYLASAETKPELCLDEKTRELIRGIMLEALDHALKVHIEHMFEVWMRDDRGQPGRARTGVQNGVQAYVDARKGAIEWTPPPCSG